MMRSTSTATNKGLRPSPGAQDKAPQSSAQAPNFLRLLAQSPAALGAFIGTEQALAHGQLTPRERELIALAVAEINNSNYCLVAHTLAARNAGLTEEDIRLARRASANDLKAEALLQFTQALVLQRGRIADRDLAAVRVAGFSDVQVMEIIANVALNQFGNYFNLVFKTEVDFPLLHPEVRHPHPADDPPGENSAPRPPAP